MARKRVVNLSWSELDILCNQMSCRLQERYGAPAMVIGISRPGYEVALRVASCWRGVPIVMAKSQRVTTGMKRSPLIKPLLERLPRRVADILRIAESMLGRNRKAPRRVEIPRVEINSVADGWILIVDDSADSGATLAGAVRAVNELWASPTVVTATITITRTGCRVKPDLSLMPVGTLVRLPWAIDAGR